ncbi:MAG: DUF6688 domain-containing protein, partial [Fusobacteriaceae bacterium]
AIEIIIGTLYIISLIVFTCGLLLCYTEFNQVVVEGYHPFYSELIIAYLFFITPYFISIIFVWVRGSLLPPISLTLSLIFIVFGMLVWTTLLINILSNTQNSDYVLFVTTPIISIVIGCILVIKVISSKSAEAIEKTYSNKYLKSLNSFLANKCKNLLWIFILMFPVCFVLTLILITLLILCC